MRYYQVKLLVGVPDDKVAEWDSTCDEIFHGPAGQYHDPTKEVYVSEYGHVGMPEEIEFLKYRLFTKEGGI